MQRVLSLDQVYLLNNLRKGIGVFFCYALRIGRLAMSFQIG